ncbi:SHOCT domain-containing protein [Halorussus litoreus]|uniref:SHOCT domain-containing protein n=1 Tax=Halorussus litoreus TaxID=1710536 RepID=UPI000E2394E7|nr:SHOCT domain-containing protein [Halorussus litoreus]
MAPPDDAARQLASMLASRADHHSVTADRLAGTADGVADLESPPVSYLAEGERPQFCFESHADGLAVGDSDATIDALSTVAPERGGVFLFTDRRVFVLLGVAEDDESVSLAYDRIESAEAHDGMGRHRVELRLPETTYYLLISSSFDRETVSKAVEYATYRRKQATPDLSDREEDADAGGPQTVRERLERLGDAKSRGLIDEEEFQRRKEELLDE